MLSLRKYTLVERLALKMKLSLSIFPLLHPTSTPVIACMHMLCLVGPTGRLQRDKEKHFLLLLGKPPNHLWVSWDLCQLYSCGKSVESKGACSGSLEDIASRHTLLMLWYIPSQPEMPPTSSWSLQEHFHETPPSDTARSVEPLTATVMCSISGSGPEVWNTTLNLNGHQYSLFNQGRGRHCLKKSLRSIP